MQELKSLERIVEAILFLHAEPIRASYIAKSLKEDEKTIELILESIRDRLQEQDGGILLEKKGKEYQLVTNPKCYAGILTFIREERKEKISSQTMEVLAIIAYRQPISLADIDKIRGAKSKYHLQKLIKRGLVEIKGHKKLPGNPPLYGTTKKFLEVLGISSLDELPSEEEIAWFLEDA